MVVLLLPERITIKSQLGNYTVDWCGPDNNEFISSVESCNVYIIDEKVWELYKDKKTYLTNGKNIIIQPVYEEIKTPATSIVICEKLLNSGFKRNDTILAIGGGIIQDLVTFSASVLFRGIKWLYIPTTLLAQADSCIGGKSSLNLAKWKNQIGNFYPPTQIYIDSDYLNTLPQQDIRSGLGEIIKVHLVSGKNMTNLIFKDLSNGYLDIKNISHLIYRALKLKSKIIEEDEFDQGKRLIMNYGHSFGHALESATNFSLPHGIAVTIGIDIANFISLKLRRVSEEDCEFMSSIVQKNIKPGDLENVDMNIFFNALSHDKKNTSDKYGFILPYSKGEVELVYINKDRTTDALIKEYFNISRN